MEELKLVKTQNWLIITIIILTLLSLFIYLIFAEPSPLPKICKEQCIKQDMNFYKYNLGGYQNAACLCKTKEDGLIKTIYIE